jgi:peroxiredoxin
VRGFEPLARSVTLLSPGDHFLSLQRPDGPEARDRWSRARVLLRCAAAAALAAAGVAAAQPEYPLIAQTAPDFTLHAAVGGNVRLSEHRGEVVVLCFWSSACSSCRTQLAALSRSLATYRSAGLEIYGIGVDDEPARALEYARRSAVAFPMLLDPAKAVSRAYQVDNLPMTVLIDRSGIVRDVLRDYSARSEELYLHQLRTLLNE